MSGTEQDCRALCCSVLERNFLERFVSQIIEVDLVIHQLAQGIVRKVILL
jgi:hypothetical protein